MDLGLAGKTALVGAGTEGLGLETARALAEEGVRVMVSSRDAAKVAAAVESIGSNAVGIESDLSHVDGANALIEHALSELGGIDILVPNVGGPPPGAAGTLDLLTLQEAVDRCLLSMVALCQGALPGMRERSWGRILAITSYGVRSPIGGMVYSNAARAGLTAYLKTLSKEVIADGITVNSILPGNQRTNRMYELVKGNEAAYTAALPAGRMGDPEDFGHIAAFLCSEWANYLTGVALSVDGGIDGASI